MDGRDWALACCLGLATAAIAAEPVTLTMPIAFGTHLPGIGDFAARLVKLVTERSGGALNLDLKEPGDGTNPQEILEKVANGKVDAGFATASLWAAKLRRQSCSPASPSGRTPRPTWIGSPPVTGANSIGTLRASEFARACDSLRLRRRRDLRLVRQGDQKSRTSRACACASSDLAHG